jgi:Flp pilus assembly protein TadD
MQDAISHYREAIRLQPDYSSAHYNLGNALLESGAFAEAVISYRHALQLKPDHAEAHNNLGIALKESHQEEEAAASYVQASNLKPDFAEPLRNLGTLFEQQGKPDEAYDALQRYLQRAPDDDMQRLHMETLCSLIAASNEAIDTYRTHLNHTLERYAAQPPRFDISTLHLSGAHRVFVTFDAPEPSLLAPGAACIPSLTYAPAERGQHFGLNGDAYAISRAAGPGSVQPESA